MDSSKCRRELYAMCSQDKLFSPEKQSLKEISPLCVQNLQNSQGRIRDLLQEGRQALRGSANPKYFQPVLKTPMKLKKFWSIG